MVKIVNMDFIQNTVINFHDGYYLCDDVDIVNFYMRHVYNHLLSSYGSLNLNQGKAAHIYEQTYFNKTNNDYDFNPRLLDMNNIIDFIEDFHHIQIGYT